jgi:inosose dehydratase
MAETPLLRIATAPVNWNNSDVPGWREHVPFPQILDEMLHAGFHVTEYDGALGSDLEAISEEMVKRSMSFCGAYFWIDTREPTVFERDLTTVIARCRALERIGCQHLIVSDILRPHRVACAGAVPPDGSLSLDADGYAAMTGRLGQLAEMSAAYGINVHYHNHAGTFIETPWELDALVANLANSGVDLCFDTGHYAFGGGDPGRFIDDNAGVIGYLHLKDVDPRVLGTAKTLRWGFIEALRHIVFPPLGQGSVGIQTIIRSLVQRRFDGFVVIEQDTCQGDPTATARANLEFVLASSSAQPVLDQEHSP